MSQLFKKLDPIVEKLHLVEFNEIKVLQLVSIKIGMGCQPAHLILISSILFGGFIVLDIASFLLTSIIGFLYPAYRSFKALQSKSEKDDKQWLTYWVVFTFFTTFDWFFSFILSFLPFYYFLKLVFYVYLFHPRTNGALVLYDNYIRPFLIKNEALIDAQLNAAHNKINQTYNKYQQQQQQNIAE